MTSNGHLPSNEPRSYWHATAPPPVPTDDLPAASDVVVVGGGMLGCWTAYWLARAGMRPTLIERTAISWGATGRNGGLVRAGLSEGFTAATHRVGADDARAIWQISLAGQQMVGQVISEERIDCDYRLGGSLSIWLDEAGLIAGQRTAATMQAEGLGGELLDRRGVQEHIGTPLGPEISGGLYFSDGAQLHSARYLAGIAGAAQRHGARLCRASVRRLTPEGEATLLETDRGTVRANAVIVAVNAWSDELVPTMRDVIKPVRGQVLSYAPLPTVFSTSVGVSATPTGEYWQQTLDGAIVLGGYRAVAPGQDVGVREMVPTPEVQGQLATLFPRLFPQLDGLRVERQWAGLMAFTRDYLPVVARIPGLERAWFGGGFCGHGMPYGPRLGQLLTEAVTSGDTPASLAPLRADRPSLASMATLA
jgi:glycine/D-amino acid oxidase-like deaminating enzyme